MEKRLPRIRTYTGIIPAGAFETINLADATFFYFVEADFRLRVSIDDESPAPLSLALGFKIERGDEPMKTLTLFNDFAVPTWYCIFAGRGTLTDARLNILEDRSGNASAAIPSTLQDTTVTIPANGVIQLLPLDYNRASVHLSSTDTTAKTYWGPDANVPEIDAARIGLNHEGVTRLKTKSPIWVKGTPGTKVTARVFGY